MPLAAFDRSGGRIGYGKGHYDTALAALKATQPVLAVGLAFSVQEVAGRCRASPTTGASTSS